MSTATHILAKKGGISETGTRAADAAHERIPLDAQATAHTPPPARSTSVDLKVSLPAPGIDHEQQVALAKDRVNSIIRHLLAELQLDVSRVQLPTVGVGSERRTSYYDASTNEIVMHPNHLDAIATYGEEIFHWLREQLKPDKEKGTQLYELPRDDQHAVDEFFGFVGRAIVLELCEETTLHTLCDHSRDRISQSEIDEHRSNQRRLHDLFSSTPIEMIPRIEVVVADLRALAAVNLHGEGLNLDGVVKRVEVLHASVKYWERALAAVPQDTHGINFQQQLANKIVALCGVCATHIHSSRIASPHESASGEQSPSLELLQAALSVADKFARQLEDYMQALDATLEQFLELQDRLDTHVRGYEAGRRFLNIHPKPTATVGQLLRKPSIDLYFDHIFPAPEPPSGATFFSNLFLKVKHFFEVVREKQRLKDEVRKQKKSSDGCASE